MKKWLLSLCMVLALTACKDEKKEEIQANADNKPVIKIGATLPLTGNEAHMAAGAQNTLQMVLEKWQNQDTKYNYEIVYENDMLKLNQAALNAQRFINFYNVNVMISMLGVVDRVIDDIADKHNIISLSCSYGKDNVPEYGINMAPQNKEIYGVALKELKKKNVKKVALAGSNSGVSNTTLDYAAQHLPEDGIEVVANERYEIGETDYRLSIQKMEQKAPDYYLIFGVEPMNSVFVRQYHELTNKNNLASLGSFPNLNPANIPWFEDIWSVYLIGGTDEFEKTYMNRFGTRVEACSANLYDGVDMLIKAFESTPPRKGSLVPDNLDVLETFKNFKTWDGVFGKMKIKKKGTIEAEVEARVYKNGQWVKIEE